MEYNQPFEDFSCFHPPDPLDPESYGLVFADPASPITSTDIVPLDGTLLDLDIDFHASSEVVDGFLQQSVTRPNGPEISLPVSSQSFEPWPRLYQPDPTGNRPSPPFLTETSLAIAISDLGLDSEETRPVRHTKSSNWEEIRSRVKVLYLDKGNTLAATRRTIKNEFNLDASQKAFKQWLREWSFKKYITKPDQEYIVKMNRRRRLSGQKSSVFRFQGNIVSDARIRKWDKVIDKSTAMPPQPPYISCVTPSPEIQERPRSNSAATKRIRHELDMDAAISLLPLTMETLSPATKNCSNPSDHPLYTEFFKPLQQSVIQISISRLRQIDHEDETTRDNTIRELEDALNGFLEQCSQHNELEFALTCFNAGGLSRLALGVFSNEKWDVGVSFNLPFLLCQARCLVASERYSDGERLIDRVLQGYRWTHKHNALQQFVRSFPAVILLAKSHLAQSQTYYLNELVRWTLAKAEALESTALVDNAILQLQKMLLISSAVMLKVEDFDVCAFGLDTEEIELIHDILEKIQYNIEERDFALGLLSYLRRRYDEARDGKALMPVLKKTEEILHPTLLASSSQPSSTLVVHSIHGLLKSYNRLGHLVAAEKWRRELTKQSSLGRTADFGGTQVNHTRVAGKDSLEMGLDSSSPGFPLRFISRQFLWKDWPRIPLPWDKLA